MPRFHHADEWQILRGRMSYNATIESCAANVTSGPGLIRQVRKRFTVCVNVKSTSLARSNINLEARNL